MLLFLEFDSGDSHRLVSVCPRPSARRVTGKAGGSPGTSLWTSSGKLRGRGSSQQAFCARLMVVLLMGRSSETIYKRDAVEFNVMRGDVIPSTWEGLSLFSVSSSLMERGVLLRVVGKFVLQ